MSVSQPPGNRETASPQPFSGVRVVEFGQFVAVPFCAQLLAEGGADVIKVEALDGDPARRQMPLAPDETRRFLSNNRGKARTGLMAANGRARGAPRHLRAQPVRMVLDQRPG